MFCKNKFREHLFLLTFKIFVLKLKICCIITIAFALFETNVTILQLYESIFFKSETHHCVTYRNYIIQWSTQQFALFIIKVGGCLREKTEILWLPKLFTKLEFTFINLIMSNDFLKQFIYIFRSEVPDVMFISANKQNYNLTSNSMNSLLNNIVLLFECHSKYSQA